MLYPVHEYTSTAPMQSKSRLVLALAEIDATSTHTVGELGYVLTVLLPISPVYVRSHSELRKFIDENAINMVLLLPAQGSNIRYAPVIWAFICKT